MVKSPPPEPSLTLPCAEPALEPPLSKNARKRLLKAERFAASKSERRARDKEKKRQRAEKRRADDQDIFEGAAKRQTKRQKVQDVKSRPKSVFQARVVIDLGFDDLMTEKEVVSLCSQLAYTYSSNRRSHSPFKSLLCTSLKGKTLARLNTLGGQYKRWQHVEFWDEGYERLWNGQGGGSDSRQACTRESMIYLTGDADQELHELKEGETYIIGGICDHNRYKNLCLNKAKEQSIRTARLPIGTYLANLPTRKILTINQVFDILLHWVEGRDWAKALYAVMPKRKFQHGNQSGGSGSSVKDDCEDQEDDANEDEDANEDANADMQDPKGGEVRNGEGNINSVSNTL